MSGSTQPPTGRRLPRGLGLGLGIALFGAAALVVYAAGIGYGRAPAFDGAALAAAAGRAPAAAGGVDPAASAIWFLLLRLAGLLRGGSAVVHAQLPSLLAGGLMAALVFARLASRVGDARATTPGPLPAGELVAAVLAAATVALSRLCLGSATAVGPAAVGGALAVAALALAERVAARPSDARAGLALAAVAGAAAGGPLAAAALGWLPGLATTLRALRRGERWPLLSPVVFVAAAGAGLLPVLRAQPGVTLHGLGAHLALLPVVRALGHISRASAAASITVVVDAVGILAVLAAGVGVAAMVAARPRPDGDPARALFFSLWPLVGGLALGAAFGSAANGTVGLMVASSALALPLAVGVLRLADRLGRARLPAAAALGIMIVVWPLFAR